MNHFAYESMGTKWNISIWDEIDPAVLSDIETTIRKRSQEFDEAYSRFKKTSLIWQLTEKRGIVKIPPDLTKMLRLYEKLHDLSSGLLNPLLGFALSDLGYDAEYSLKPKEAIRPVPKFHDALRIVDDTHIELRESVLIDLGALGKGFFVDKLSSLLKDRGIRRFLVDGSGDIFYEGSGETIRAGLEHPDDPTKVIGVVEMKHGAMCSSAGNRRKWAGYHHTINPLTLTSPDEIVATWVLADSAAVADGLATCLFLTEPEKFEESFQFEYCIMNSEHRVKRSKGFQSELF